MDVAAIGVDPKSKKETMYLLTIKSGNIGRADWDNGAQSLRRSLNEIIEYYIPRKIAKRYQSLPVKIAICFGGDIDGHHRPVVDAYLDDRTKKGEVEFEEWNGDHIVKLIADGILRESIFPKSIQGELRKALAFVDEPAICKVHFQRVLVHLEGQTFKNKGDRLTAIRQIYLVVWNIFVWGRDAENLDAAYLCSESALLWVWDMSKEHIKTNSPVAKDFREALNKLSSLNHTVSSSYIALHVAPYCNTKDGFASSVQSRYSLDINLKLFEALGRTAANGLYLLHLKQISSGEENDDVSAQLQIQIDQTVELLYRMIDLNPVLNSPIRDDHAIEITLVGLFLLGSDQHQNFSYWIEQISLACEFEFSHGRHYPCIFGDYAELAVHPRITDGYQQEATIGSILYPSLAIWCAMFNNESTLKKLSDFERGAMSHSTWQIWFPSADTEQHLYKNTARHGASFSDLNLQQNAKELREQLYKEMTASNSFQELSAIKAGIWPLVLIACRHYRLPVPPHYWMIELGDNED